MPKDRLTEVSVRKALPPARGQILYWDDQLKGFALRVTAGGARAFVFDYRAGGRQRRVTIGAYPDWSAAAARKEATRLKREVDRGGDPMGERHAERGAATMDDLWERYAREFLPLKAAQSQVNERAMWANLARSRLGKLKVAAVTHADIDALHRDVTNVRGAPILANRMVAMLRRMLNLARRWQWRPDNPASGARRNPEEPRQRYLKPAELAALVHALNERESPSANAIKLLMLTGARRGEVLGARWDQFDLENGIWTKPSAHTKQRRLHRVPLSGHAIRLLREMKQTASGPHVFPGADGKPLGDVKRTWTAICKRAGLSDVRLHDLRHTFASLLVSSGASLPLIGQMLGHTQPQTTARYAHLYDNPLRAAADAVGAAVLATHKLKDVTPRKRKEAVR